MKRLFTLVLIAVCCSALIVVVLQSIYRPTQPTSDPQKPQLVESPVWNFFSTPAQRAADTQPAAPLITEDGKEVFVVRIGANEYHVPPGYLRFVPLKLHAVENDLLIDAALPDMHEIAPGSAEAIKSPSDVIQILAVDAASTTDSAFRLNVIQNVLSPLQPVAQLYGLSTSIGSKGFAGQLDFDTARFHKEFSDATKDDYHAILLIDPSDATTPLFIECNGDREVPYPGCSEIFTDSGLLYKVSYSKTHLSEWKRIRVDTAALFQGFVRKSPAVSASQKQPSTK